jgi:hypothetical protein
MLYEIRVGAPDGPPSPVKRCNPGLVDFAQLRVFYTSTVVTKRGRYPGETLWMKERMFSRDTNSEPWSQIRPVTWLEPGAMPFGAPLWLLGALSGTDSATAVGEEGVRGVATTQFRAVVNWAQARRCSRWPLGFPRTHAATFPAVVWLDDYLRIMRMACDWQPTTNGRFRRLLERTRAERSAKRRSWITTEFWDYGVDASVPGGVPSILGVTNRCR